MFHQAGKTNMVSARVFIALQITNDNVFNKDYFQV